SSRAVATARVRERLARATGEADAPRRAGPARGALGAARLGGGAGLTGAARVAAPGAGDDVARLRAGRAAPRRPRERRAHRARQPQRASRRPAHQEVFQLTVPTFTQPPPAFCWSIWLELEYSHSTKCSELALPLKLPKEGPPVPLE